MSCNKPSDFAINVNNPSKYVKYRDFSLNVIMLSAQGGQPQLTTITGGNYEKSGDYSGVQDALQREVDEIEHWQTTPLRDEKWFSDFYNEFTKDDNVLKKLILYERTYAFTNYYLWDGYDCSLEIFRNCRVPKQCMDIPSFTDVLQSIELINYDDLGVSVRTLVIVGKFFQHLRNLMEEGTLNPDHLRMGQEDQRFTLGYELSIEASVTYEVVAMLGEQDSFYTDDFSRKRTQEEVNQVLEANGRTLSAINTMRHPLSDEFCGDIIIYKQWMIEISIDPGNHDTEDLSLVFFQGCNTKDLEYYLEKVQNETDKRRKAEATKGKGSKKRACSPRQDETGKRRKTEAPKGKEDRSSGGKADDVKESGVA